MLYCALATVGYLLVVNWGLSAFERRLISQGHLQVRDGAAEVSLATRLWDFIVQWFLFAGLPMGLYSWLFVLLPLEGPRAGVAIALWTVVIGSLPFAIVVSERHKVPFVAMAFLMFSQLVRLLGTLAIIGILFAL
jgi:hypothetical protein